MPTDSSPSKEPSIRSSRPIPITLEERTLLIDVVRGFALFGVLLANMVWLSQEIALTSEQLSKLPTAGIDRISRYFVQFFIDGKFVTLFSFLFGLGFSVQLSRAESRNASIVPVYMRRLFILLCFGLMHAYLLWYGDILVFYALLGFALILFRLRSDRTLITWGLILAILVPVLVLAIRSKTEMTSPAVKAVRLAAFTKGTYLDVFPENAKINASFWLKGIFLFTLPHIFGKFLLGFYAGRRHLLQNARENLRFFRRLMWLGLAIGLICNSAWVLIANVKLFDDSSPWLVASHFSEFTGMVALAAFYLSALTLLFQRATWKRNLLWLAPVGRMALTNYLMQSVINLFLFYGYGFALMGKIGTTCCVLISIIVFALQIVLSNWWLSQFHFGPLEWLWRSLTYWKPQTMKRESISSKA